MILGILHFRLDIFIGWWKKILRKLENSRGLFDLIFLLGIAWLIGVISDTPCIHIHKILITLIEQKSINYSILIKYYTCWDEEIFCCDFARSVSWDAFCWDDSFSALVCHRQDQPVICIYIYIYSKVYPVWIDVLPSTMTHSSSNRTRAS